ncbi:MAG: glycosyl hydrolase family 18 protein [Melioribacteraceae bacterium]|jgi:spore germination protein YaaH|nr:glycosyl hydrolase family 18 protein [Melioribacteraceae bacterium]
MLKHIITLLLFILTSSLVGQQFSEYSVHKAQRDEFKTNENRLSKFSSDGSGIIPLQINAQKELSKIVFGYMPDWEYNSGSHANQHYNLLTHIATFDFPVSSTGSVGLPSSWPWTDVINSAHTAGTKVIMTAVNFDSLDIRNIINNETAKQEFFNDTKNIIQTYQLDGVNVDFESLRHQDKADSINNFMTELTAFIHTELPGKEVSFAGPAVNWRDRWDLDGLVQSCDYVFIMGYAFWGKWSSTAGPGAPLTGFTHDITSVVTEDYGDPVSKYPEKLILGVPYYGHKWKTLNGNAYSKVDTANGGFQGSTRFYNDVENADIYGLLWDNISQTSWFHWQEGTQWYQTWFDDVSSLDAKYNLALAQNLGGVGMWALGYDGEKQDLWNLIKNKFPSDSLSIPNSFRVIQHNSNTLILEFEKVRFAEKYGIYLSNDGIDFERITESISNSVSITNLKIDSVYYFKVDAINSSGSSAQTEVLAGIPSGVTSEFLIVNGFDRTSGTINTFDYIRMYDYPMTNIGVNFSSASNEAVSKGYVNLSDYQFVIWMLMNESSTDETFNLLEQTTIMKYIDNGGAFVVSGSEVGWDLVAKGSDADKEFYQNYLKANYIEDAPNNENATYYTALDLDGFEYNFDNGTNGTIDVDWPDAIEAVGGAENIFTYKNVSTSLGYAGVKYREAYNKAGGVVYLAFPIEAVYNDLERTRLLESIINGFAILPSVKDDGLNPNEFALYQNYPNPFNPSTVIKYSIPSNANNEMSIVKLSVFDILGREVATLVNKEQSAGNYEVKFDASGITSGMYFYKLHFLSSSTSSFLQTKKMLLLK